MNQTMAGSIELNPNLEKNFGPKKFKKPPGDTIGKLLSNSSINKNAEKDTNNSIITLFEKFENQTKNQTIILKSIEKLLSTNTHPHLNPEKPTPKEEDYHLQKQEQLKNERDAIRKEPNVFRRLFREFFYLSEIVSNNYHKIAGFNQILFQPINEIERIIEEHKRKGGW